MLGERIDIVGTPLSLNYRSDRVPGNKAVAKIDIPLSGTSVPASLKRIDLRVGIAGRSFEQSFSPAPNQAYTFIWDGLDAYTRRLQGSQQVTIDISYVYDGFYYAPAEFARAFGFASNSGGTAITASRARQEITLVQSSNITLSGSGISDARAFRLGGWTINAHHFYDPISRELHLGSGSRRTADHLSHVFKRVAGGGTGGALWGGAAPAKDISISVIRGLAVGPDGSIYFPENNIWDFLQRVRPDGIAETLAGQTSFFGPFGNGGPAVDARVPFPRDVAVGPDGSVYIAHGNVVRRITPDGIINAFAGGGSPPDGIGDGSPALQARLDKGTSNNYITSATNRQGECLK